MAMKAENIQRQHLEELKKDNASPIRHSSASNSPKDGEKRKGTARKSINPQKHFPILEVRMELLDNRPGIKISTRKPVILTDAKTIEIEKKREPQIVLEKAEEELESIANIDKGAVDPDLIDKMNASLNELIKSPDAKPTSQSIIESMDKFIESAPHSTEKSPEGLEDNGMDKVWENIQRDLRPELYQEAMTPDPDSKDSEDGLSLKDEDAAALKLAVENAMAMDVEEEEPSDWENDVPPLDGEEESDDLNNSTNSSDPKLECVLLSSDDEGGENKRKKTGIVLKRIQEFKDPAPVVPKLAIEAKTEEVAEDDKVEESKVEEPDSPVADESPEKVESEDAGKDLDNESEKGEDDEEERLQLEYSSDEDGDAVPGPASRKSDTLKNETPEELEDEEEIKRVDGEEVINRNEDEVNKNEGVKKDDDYEEEVKKDDAGEEIKKDDEEDVKKDDDELEVKKDDDEEEVKRDEDEQEIKRDEDEQEVKRDEDEDIIATEESVEKIPDPVEDKDISEVQKSSLMSDMFRFLEDKDLEQSAKINEQDKPDITSTTSKVDKEKKTGTDAREEDSMDFDDNELVLDIESDTADSGNSRNADDMDKKRNADVLGIEDTDAKKIKLNNDEGDCNSMDKDEEDDKKEGMANGDCSSDPPQLLNMQVLEEMIQQRLAGFVQERNRTTILQLTTHCETLEKSLEQLKKKTSDLESQVKQLTSELQKYKKSNIPVVVPPAKKPIPPTIEIKSPPTATYSKAPENRPPSSQVPALHTVRPPNIQMKPVKAAIPCALIANTASPTQSPASKTPSKTSTVIDLTDEDEDKARNAVKRTVIFNNVSPMLKPTSQQPQRPPMLQPGQVMVPVSMVQKTNMSQMVQKTNMGQMVQKTTMGQMVQLIQQNPTMSQAQTFRPTYRPRAPNSTQTFPNVPSRALTYLVPNSTANNQGGALQGQLVTFPSPGNMVPGSRPPMQTILVRMNTIQNPGGNPISQFQIPAGMRLSNPISSAPTSSNISLLTSGSSTVSHMGMRPTMTTANRMTMSNQTRMVTATTSSIIRPGPAPLRPQHPGPLPPQPIYSVNPLSGKQVPPKPALKLSRVANGIVLSWNMTINPSHSDISAYQLYAYQEANTPPSTQLWKKVGDVKALPLPMACTLTQFVEGNKYYFAVRAVDVNGRYGPFSDPTVILLPGKKN